jgi:hypothetical protein
MNSEAAGEYIALVVQLQTTSDGSWRLLVDNQQQSRIVALTPATLIIRLWRGAEGNTLRGTVRLEGTDRWAPLQSNTQLEELVRAWLFAGDGSTPSN